MTTRPSPASRCLSSPAASGERYRLPVHTMRTLAWDALDMTSVCQLSHEKDI
jgi:hypothetical protein